MRALNARDVRFDGVFFVAITSTGIYCRPVCPTRVARAENRRFFDSAASAERAGYRPCLRCRPELAPGLAVMDAVPRLARIAAHRIGSGALNGRAVAELARELGVSERHLRRALEREFGVSPVELAQTHRLLLAKRLLADTSLSVTHIAFASGFQSLRRFNSVFRERYRLSPSAVRRMPRKRPVTGEVGAAPANDLVKLTLAYRAPLAWNELIWLLSQAALPGVEVVEGRRYGRTVQVEGHRGMVFATDAAPKPHVTIEISPSLVPVLMPLLARLRQLFDLDAEPTAIDAHLAEGGLGALVARRPGVRIPGALDGFEAVLRVLLRGLSRAGTRVNEVARRVVDVFGEELDTGCSALVRLTPSAARIAESGASRLVALGAPLRRAELIVSVARAIADRTLSLELGSDLVSTNRALTDLVGARIASAIVMRALYWPDAFPFADPSLRRTVGFSSAQALRACAEQWRPWRAYAAVHLWLHAHSTRLGRERTIESGQLEFRAATSENGRSARIRSFEDRHRNDRG
jgi:AraC family transcriptional regulator of adaptative response / DNA-3-methyladenine glycosylase II